MSILAATDSTDAIFEEPTDWGQIRQRISGGNPYYSDMVWWPPLGFGLTNRVCRRDGMPDNWFSDCEMRLAARFSSLDWFDSSDVLTHLLAKPSFPEHLTQPWRPKDSDTSSDKRAGSIALSASGSGMKEEPTDSEKKDSARQENTGESRRKPRPWRDFSKPVQTALKASLIPGALFTVLGLGSIWLLPTVKGQWYEGLLWIYIFLFLGCGILYLVMGLFMFGFKRYRSLLLFVCFSFWSLGAGVIITILQMIFIVINGGGAFTIFIPLVNFMVIASCSIANQKDTE